MSKQGADLLLEDDSGKKSRITLPAEEVGVTLEISPEAIEEIKDYQSRCRRVMIDCGKPEILFFR